MNHPLTINQYWREYPHKVLQAYGQESAKGKIISNSRLGHMMIAAGRQIPQELEIINQSILDKSFYRNQTLLDCFKYAREHNSSIHFLGMISDAGVNSHINHLMALFEMAHRQNFSRIYVDAITDGLDAKTSALKFIDKINKKIKEIGLGHISSVIGRNWVMLRRPNFPKLEKVYQALVEGKAPEANTTEEAISQNYQAGGNDADIPPTLVQIKGSPQTIKANDVVIFFNFRGDRSKELAKLLSGQLHKLFWRPKLPQDLLLATFVRYSKVLTGPVIFPRKPLTDILPSILGQYQKRNLRLTESIKRPHVTYHFNGGRLEPFPHEERQILPTSETESFALTPAMAGAKITRTAIEAIRSKRYDFILINFPNADIVGHTGNIIAAGQAIKAVDGFLKKIVEANLAAGGATIISADHGNVEQMGRREGAGEAKAHTFNPVPFILVAADRKKNLIQGALSIPYSTLSKIVTAKNNLADIAPTILELLNLPRSEVMTGHSLLNQLE